MKRLGVFFFYDKDGVVDSYVEFLLQEARPFFSYLLTVCNGKLTPEGIQKLKLLSDQVLVRENKGFDSWAYKEGMELLGNDFINSHDELILFNFTNFGPLFPFSEMFNTMDKKNIDFWGLTTHHGWPTDPFDLIPEGYIPEHLQSHWIAIRKRMFISPEFHLYWKYLPQIKSYNEAVAKHEAIFTKHFNDKGFRHCSYIDTQDIKNLTEYPLLFAPLDMLKRRCPIIKRKSFFVDYQLKASQGIGRETLDAYEYIKDNTLYDINLIWDNLLRTCHQQDLLNNLYLNYVLPLSTVIKENQNKSDKPKIALIIHCYFEDLFEGCLTFIESMPIDSDIYLTTDTKEKSEELTKLSKKFKDFNIKVVIVKNQGRNKSALLVSFQKIIHQYDYACFIHSKKTNHSKPLLQGRNFFERCVHNLLCSKEYVLNIISTFENNPRLGLLMPPIQTVTIGNEWVDSFQNTKELSKKLRLNVPIDNRKLPCTPLGGMFWFRPKALKTLFNYGWSYEDFPSEPLLKKDEILLHAIERIYSFVAQDAGFFSAYVMSDYFARTELTDQSFMLKHLFFRKKNKKNKTARRFFHIRYWKRRLKKNLF